MKNYIMSFMAGLVIGSMGMPTVAAQALTYEQCKQELNSWSPIAMAKRKLCKPTRQEFDAIKQQAEAKKDLQVQNYVHSVGVATAWHHHPAVELVKLPFTWVWSNKGTIALIVIIAWMQEWRGFKQGYDEAAEHAHALGHRRCLVQIGDVGLGKSGHYCTVSTPHTHILTQLRGQNALHTVTYKVDTIMPRPGM